MKPPGTKPPPAICGGCEGVQEHLIAKIAPPLLLSNFIVTDSAPPAMVFTPDLLAAAAVIARARKLERQPGPMMVRPDGSEAAL